MGGVNEKIEGFFNACHLKGADSRQGVIIPVQNVRNLMLREEVVDAVKGKRFSIYAISHVNEAIELLLDTPAGERDAEGNFPPESVFGKVAARLETWRLAEKHEDKDDDEEHEKDKPVHEHVVPDKKVRGRR